jgi:hypothetical protein
VPIDSLRVKRSQSDASHSRPRPQGVRGIDLVKLLGLFQKLVTRTCYLPRIDVDGIAQV